jgi:hypothetical protein
MCECHYCTLTREGGGGETGNKHEKRVAYKPRRMLCEWLNMQGRGETCLAEGQTGRQGFLLILPLPLSLRCSPCMSVLQSCRVVHFAASFHIWLTSPTPVLASPPIYKHTRSYINSKREKRNRYHNKTNKSTQIHTHRDAEQSVVASCLCTGCGHCSHPCYAAHLCASSAATTPAPHTLCQLLLNKLVHTAKSVYDNNT